MALRRWEHMTVQQLLTHLRVGEVRALTQPPAAGAKLHQQLHSAVKPCIVHSSHAPVLTDTNSTTSTMHRRHGKQLPCLDFKDCKNALSSPS